MLRLFALVAAAFAMPASALAHDIEVTAYPITVFSRSEPSRVDFGKLTFRSGVQLTSKDPDFGGFSGLRLSADGRRLTAISDRGRWLTADVDYEAGRLKGLSGADLRAFPGPGRNRELPIMRDRDAEGLEINFNHAWVSLERRHRVLRFDLDREGRPVQAVTVATPKEIKKLKGNAGLEAIARLPATHPFPGALLTIAEEGFDDEGDHPAWILGAGRAQELSLAHRDGYAVTDLAMLPNGDGLVLERRYRPPLNLSMRLRRIPGETIMPGARLDGEVLMEASLSQEIDNMEGVSVHQEAGETVISIISDDNLSVFQKTVLLQFTLKE
ncbi:hypothetical protein GCM10007276_31030 [Agaricicola taiwanensis]|uniref:Phytase-like domain-containing protein n=1 Tax=Agaricicola taiwanensis TaxID=591372 RepID=A0A8J2YLV1_9RHOB|nr:esterase-like activity of phytase family protein [Agaricicola taiwanensis]GGE51766.1 hypothetical protein GCM10007276_31030 [Agaricicola taiwanensis]